MIDESRLADLFEASCVLGSEERQRFLEKHCGEDTAIRKELSRLLAAHDAATAEPLWHRSALENEAAAEAAAPTLEIGKTIGSYKIEGLIGSGGMGNVYRATRDDDQYKKVVAIKCLHAGMDAARIVARFRSERQILANLDHPNITRLLDGGATPTGLPYIVMEFVEGIAPTAYCNGKNLSLPARLVLFRQICSAVHFAHQRMVIHRDLKPSNILVTTGGVPKLLDFGIAKVLTSSASGLENLQTETAMQLMTVRYASPEQVRGEIVTTATDIYSLGVLLYELISGHSPYRDPAASAHQLMLAVCEETPQRPSAWRRELRGDLDTILLKALRKDPAERYASVDQFSDDIQRYLEGRPVLARGESFTYVAAKFVRRHKIAVGAGLLAFWMLVGGFILTVRARTRAERRFNEVRQLAHSVMFDYHDAIEHLPGSTPVLERLVKDALWYLDSLSQDSDDPALQRELAEAYVRISNVQGDSSYNNLGDSAGAMHSADKAVEIVGRLLARDQSLDSKVTASMAFEAKGILLHGAGDLHGAEQQLRESVALRETVARDRPNLDAQLALASGWSRLGDLCGSAVMQNLGRPDETLELYEKAYKLMRQYSQQFPDEGRVLKLYRTTVMQLSAVEADLGHGVRSTSLIEEAVRLSEVIVGKEPKNTAGQFELANVTLRAGLRMVDQNEPGKGSVLMTRSEGLLETLLVADSKNALYQRSLSVTENQIAAALLASGTPDKALAHNRRSLELAKALSAADPKSVEYLADTGISYRKYAESLLASGDARQALEQASQGQKILCGAAKDSPDTYLQGHCGKVTLVTAKAQMKAGLTPQAVASFDQAVAIAERLAAGSASATTLSDAARAQTDAGLAFLQLGRQGEGEQLTAKARENWKKLRAKKALSPDDARRAEQIAVVLPVAQNLPVKKTQNK